MDVKNIFCLDGLTKVQNMRFQKWFAYQIQQLFYGTYQLFVYLRGRATVG